MKLALILFKYGVRLDDPCCFPLGFMYISAVLKRLGHDVTIYNLNISDDYPDDFRVFDAVLMTGFEEFLPRIKATAAECRKVGVKTVLGGALATFKPQEMLQYVDTVIIGEGEEVINTALYSSGIVQGTKPNLDNLPIPDYEGFGIKEYHRRNGIKHVGVLTSRGCPWSCSFCAHTCQFQYRDLGKVFDEVDYYREKYNPDLLVFNDNTLNVSKERFLQICHRIKNAELPWTGAIRLDQLDEESIIAAKSANCLSLVVGVESLDQKKLDMMNKNISKKQILDGLDLLEKYRIRYTGNILLGFDGETLEDIRQEVLSLPERYNLHPILVQPFVGTKPIKRNISLLDADMLNGIFADMAIRKGMTVDMGVTC